MKKRQDDEAVLLIGWPWGGSFISARHCHQPGGFWRASGCLSGNMPLNQPAHHRWGVLFWCVEDVERKLPPYLAPPNPSAEHFTHTIHKCKHICGTGGSCTSCNPNPYHPPEQQLVTTRASTCDERIFQYIPHKKTHPLPPFFEKNQILTKKITKPCVPRFASGQ